MTEAVWVAVETPLQQGVAALLAQSDAVAARLYPGEYRRAITAEALAQPGTHVLVARLARAAIGLAVVFERGDGTIEVKRMIVDAAARRRGGGAALLGKAHAEASRLGVHTVLLEVGIHNIEAQALYRGAGYRPRRPFAPYQASPISIFMELSL